MNSLNPINVLVLGSNGMLGSSVYKTLSIDKNFKTFGTQRKNQGQKNYFDVINMESINNILDDYSDVEYIVNCIGLTQVEIEKLDKKTSEERTMKINSFFPKYLSEICIERGIKVISISSDGVFSGKNGPYNESDKCDPIGLYSHSKLKGEVSKKNFLNLRCSIIGPDPIKQRGLFEWFKNCEDPIIYGYSNQLWNGLTTLQYARLCKQIFLYGYFDELTSLSSIHHVDINKEISKYELLKIFKNALKKNVKLFEKKRNNPLNRVLKSNYDILKNIYFYKSRENETSWKKLILEFI